VENKGPNRKDSVYNLQHGSGRKNAGQMQCKEEVEKTVGKASSFEIKVRWKTTGSHTGNKNLSLRQNENNVTNVVLHDTKLRKAVPVWVVSSGRQSCGKEVKVFLRYSKQIQLISSLLKTDLIEI